VPDLGFSIPFFTNRNLRGMTDPRARAGKNKDELGVSCSVRN